MSRGIKPTKGKAKAKRSVARTPRKKADTSVRVRQLEERLSEARAQQAAASDVLRVIASSPTDIQPVFELIAERAMRLCGALHGGVLRFDGELIHLAAHAHASPAFVDALQRIYPMRPGRSTAGARAILTRAVVHVPDIAADLEYEIRSTARAAGFRSTVAVPMLQDDRALGAIVVLGDSATSFSPQQIELLRTFADQAVIAIENVRLFQESDARNRALAEALEQQTATSEVLRVISSSPTDIQPVLDTVAESAARLCESIDAIIFLRDGDGLRPAAHHGPISLGAMREVGLPLVRGTAPGRAVLDGRTVHIADMQKEIDEFPESSENARRMGFRTNLCVPLVREGETIGTIALRRNEVRPFTERQVALLKTFADQAVIAIENVRLFKELAARNADLTDSLEQQTATSEILRVISGSHVDVEPVFEVIVRSAVRLLGGLSGLVTRVADDQLHLAAITSTDRSGDEAQQATWPRPLRGPTLHNQVIERLAPCACPDMESDPSRTPSEVAVARSRGFRSLLVVPLLRDGRALGTLGVTRCAAGPFSDGEVALLQTFADQAVIAIENVRLFTQLEARNRDLTETLEQQTATGEVLRVISSSPTDIQPVLDTVAESAARLCDAFDAAIWLRESDRLRIAAHHGSIPAQPTLPLIRGTSNGRAILDGRTVHIADMQAEAGEFPEGATNARRMGHRTILCVPLMREGVAIGTLQLRRRETRLFTERQVALLETFADQAVIAIENARLFTELEARNRDLTETLEQQTATGEILRVISGSPTDVQPVFDTIAQSAARLCDGELCFVFRFEDGLLHFVAHHGLTPDRAQVVGSSWPAAPDRGSAVGRAVLDGRAAHIADALEDPEYRLGAVATAASFRSMVAVPMEREGLPIGAISVLRSQPGPFSTRQIELLKTFADQAVIAVENVRLFDELEARNRDLAVSLEQQTATSEVLKVISRSAFDLEPVLENVIESATRLCGATRGHIFRFDGDMLRFAAAYGAWPGFTDYLEKNPVRPGAGSVAGRAAFERRTLHVPDVRQEPEYQYGELLNQQDYRAVLAVPMLREDVLLGVIVILKSTVEPFSDKQIELVTTFADQAVIAIENVRLFKELEARNHELTDTLEQQTATSEVLKVISRSAFDLQPVFDTLTENVVRLCDAERAFLFRFDGDFLRAAAWYNASPEIVEAVQRNPMSPGRHSSAARAALDRRTVHIPDIQADPEYAYSPARADGVRTVLSVPMLKGDALVGVLTIFKLEVRPFTDKQVALVETFADQAVIAIENVRLFQELEAKNHDLTQTLEQQTATSEILRVISSSPTDVQPVFDTIVASAVRLCAARMGAVYRFDDELVHLVAHHNYSPEVLAVLQQMHPRPPQIDQASGRAILTRAVAQIEDTLADPQYPREVALVPGGFRSVLAVPMLRDGAPIGAIVITRSEAGPFPDGHIELVKTFAAQAVIAVENVWLFTELEARNSELKVSLEQQTATSELLKVIGRSTFDLEPVFEALAESAVRLCEAERGVILRFDGQVLRFAVGHNVSPELRAFFEQNPIPPGRHTNAGRAALTRRTVHNHDVLSDPEYRYGGSQVDPYRTVLSIPMLRGDELLGVIVIYRHEVRPFTDNQVALMETFADQAAIAIENVRLFHELETRNRDLSEALAQQTATSEVLKVISRSTFDLEPVLQTLIENAARLCHAEGGVIYKSDGDLHRLAAAYNISQEFRDFVAQNPLGPGAGTAVGRAMLEGRTIHIHDVREDPTYTYSGVSLGGYRTILGVPMLREGLPIGVFSVWRTQVLPFTDRQIELVTSFADQGAIAIENVRLFQELEARTRELTRSVDELRALGEVSQAVGSTLDLEAVLVTIVSRAVQLSGSDQGIVYEFDEATQTFHQRATHQVSGEYLEAVRSAPIRLGEGAIGRAGVTREPVQIADLQADLQLVAPQVRAYLTHEGMRSLLAIPLIQEERLLGGLVILRREQGAFSPEVVATLRTFATQSVLAINNARLFREIQRQKQYSDALVETSPVAIVTLDLHGMVMGWNPGAERLFGYTQDEVMGRELAELVATPEMREEVRTAIRTTLEGERFRAITRRARKDGTLVDVDTSAKFVVVDGVQVGLIAIYHDITELLQARREAEAANEAKSAFLATMSHEIRTPMNAVIGMSGLLLNTDLSDEQREYAEVVRQSGDALLTVINDILDFSKIEAGKLELESQPFDLRECLESALDLVATRAAEKGLDLAYLFGDGTPAAIVGDVTRLRQILLNLLSNAVKFTESGEVVLSVSATRLDAHAPLYEMTFIVRDTGIGIPPERLDRLFQSFSQVDASTTRRYGGTGLGLAISQRLTELMGGRISVTSEVGVGSEFRFTVRAAASLVPVPTRRDLSGVQPSLRGKRVLVVDDNATNRRILTTYLDAWGMQARATESPREALEWIRADAGFDIGILDMHMPEMDGVALARTIREHRPGDMLPLILFTSLGRRESRADSEGFAAYLHKPIKPSQLFDALVSVLAEQPVHVQARGTARTDLDPRMAERHPLRILLAEDNVVNQKVAIRLLGQMGYRADVAGNGLEAIEAIERQTYDVVLMDVQMPELDGFGASREINRRWPGERHPRIVAMTANAMQGDRELCEAAGMDDYVAKPIRVEELVAALLRCRLRSDTATRSEPTTAAATTGAPAPQDAGGGATSIDAAVIDGLTATMGSPFIAELIGTFGEDAQELIATLRQALSGADLDMFRRAAHSLKSTSETLGATRLATMARELEAMARAGTIDGTADRVERLAAEYQIVADLLGEVRRDLPA